MLTENALCEAGFSRRSAKWTVTGAMAYRSLRTARKIQDIRDGSRYAGWMWEKPRSDVTERWHALKQSVNKIPDHKSSKLSHQKQYNGPERTYLVESKSDGDHVTYERNPCEKCHPDSVSVQTCFLTLKGFRLDLEPFLDPFPFADPTYPVGEDASEPVAKGADKQSADRVGCSCKYGDI